MSFANAAGCSNPKMPIWHAMQYCKIVWTVKWGHTGLAPVRRQIVLETDLTIKPGHSVLLN